MLIGQGTLIAGRYVVERKIGEGNWGEVWLGHHAHVGMRVAIKALLEAKAASHDAIVRFEREAKFLGRIQSDYVARVLDFFNDDIYGLILVMELIDGESLSDALVDGKITIERAIDIGCDLVAGLCDLHAARVVHRDMKPANVILRPLATGGTRAVIIDFSLGRLLVRPGEAESSFTQLTAASMAVGTLPYMSPEQVLDSRKVTVASDVYAVGAMLYRCVKGDYVFTDEGDAVVARKKLSVDAPRLITGRTDEIAQAFEKVIGKALRRRPEDRYPDARAMLKELLALKNRPAAPPPEPPPAPTPAAEPPPTSPPQVSNTMLAIAGVSLLGAGLAIGLGIGDARWNHPAPVVSASTATVSPPAAIVADLTPDAEAARPDAAQDEDADTTDMPAQIARPWIIVQGSARPPTPSATASATATTTATATATTTATTTTSATATATAPTTAPTTTPTPTPAPTPAPTPTPTPTRAPPL